MKSLLISRRARRSHKACNRFFIEGIDLECRTLLSVVDVFGYRYAQPNTVSQPNNGLNAQESILQPSNVNINSFGKKFDTQVDGQVYAQPMMKSGVNITVGPEPGLHNVIYVATQHDSLYAIDATSGHILWKDSFIDPAQGITTVPWEDVISEDIVPEIGITSTPVIDPQTNILYLVAKTKVQRAVGANYVLTLHAITLADGKEAMGGPVVIADTYWDGSNSNVFSYVSGPAVPGTGDGAVNGIVNFNALRGNQRCALTLYNNQVYVMTASHGDISPYHGWILGYSTADLSLKTVFNSTPNGSDGSFWMSGAGIAIDPQGFMYVASGNGTFDTTFDAKGFPINGNYGDTLLKLTVDPTYTHTVNGWGLKVVDYFTPSNQSTLNANDFDLGSSGPMIFPDSAGSAAHPHLMTVMGKEPRMFLIDRDNMGRFNPNGEQVVQILTDGLKGAYTSPAFAGSTMYVATSDNNNMAFTVANGLISSSAISQSTQTFAYPGANPTLSFNAGASGIEWVLDPTSSQLLAYSSTNLVTPIYGSNQAAYQRDILSGIVKFTVPVVANGMVYVGTTNSIAGFGSIANLPTAASFVKQDTTTQGTWKGVYGTDGFDVSQDSSANNPTFPSYAAVGFSNALNSTWTNSTLDVRALQKTAVNSIDRIAGIWFNDSSFSINVGLIDGGSHQVTLYALDFDRSGRTETIQVINTITGAVLDTRSISSFGNGAYMVWNVSGRVTIKITNTGPSNAVISGIFFNTPSTAPIITTQPTSATVNVGSTATFLASASGTPAPSVQWQLSTNSGSTWTDISGATLGSYTTPPTTLANNGSQYRAVFSNLSGTASTTAATLTVRASSSDTAVFTKLDTTTQGNWKLAYGVDGFDVSQDPSANNPTFPSYAAVGFTSALNGTWVSSTTDVRALQKTAVNSTDRIAATWFNDSSFSIKVQANDTNVHQVALYALDFDKAGRSEMVQVISNTTGAVLDTRSISSFQNGVYLVWNLSGSVTLKITNTGTANAVMSGLFFGSSPTAPTTVTFVKQDTSTQGSWKSVYGADGFDVSQDPSANNPTFPSYAAIGFSNTLNGTWVGSTTDVRALQKTAVNSTDRIAATWFNDSSFTIRVGLTDGGTHQVVLYALDFDRAGRSETIQVINNATGLVLDSRSISSFGNGVYLVWNVSGSVTFKVINTGPGNAVISGLFFGATSSASTTANFVKQDATTQGTWRSVYGTNGFVVSQDPSANNPSLPSYAAFSINNASNFVWNSSTTNVRALQKASPSVSDRIAACWFSNVSFTLNLALNDGKSHTIALYALDWDNAGRTETIQVLDSVTQVVLDTRSLASFQNGVYMVWNITGNVSFITINTGPGNAVVSGIFLS